MKWLVNYSLSFFLSCWLFIPGFAQNESDRFRFEHITVNEGLAHSDAMAVTQDLQGFTWVGTNKGINRYDGYELKKYDLPVNDRNGITSNRIRTLHVSPNGQLWVGSEYTGLYGYNANQDAFQSIGAYPAAPACQPLLQRLTQTGVSAICSDRAGRIWVGTQRYGVFVLETDPNGHIRTVKQIHLGQPSTPNGSVSPLSVSKLVADGQGTVWIGAYGGGLWKISPPAPGPNNRTLVATPVTHFPTASVRTLHLDRRGDLWIGTNNQVFWVNRKQLIGIQPFVARPLKRTFGSIESLYLDSFQRLWIGTSFGLLLMSAGPETALAPPVDPSRVHTFLPLDTDPFSINSVRVHEILEDRFHNLWLATSAGGLNQLKLSAKPFVHLRRQLSGQATPANNYINAVLKETGSNRLWIGTRNGFASYDLIRKTYQNYLNRALSGNVNGVDVSAFCKSANGTLWVGTRQNGLYRMTESGALTRIPNLPGGPEWGSISIETLVEDRFGTLWVGTFSHGLHRFNGQGQHLASYTATVLPSSQFTFLLADGDHLWASTREAGLLKLRITADSLTLMDHFVHQPHNPNSLSTNYTWPLLKDRQGGFWIGTIGGGLHRLTTDAQGQSRIERYSRWVPEMDVESLLSDESGNLWIGGAGLYQFNPVARRLVHYDVADGLQSNSFKVGSAYRSADGTMYFGGTNGITFFQPRTIRANPYAPLMQVTGLRIMNQPVAVGDTVNGRVVLAKPFSAPQDIRIHAAENDFSIEFVGISYDNPQKHRYAYRLEGYNDEWVYPAPGQRTASFSNLPAGTYTFRVKGSNGDGIWSPRAAALTFTVLPPWWKTWWAYLLYGAGIIGALALYRRAALKQQELRNTLAFEKFQNEKEKEITDLKLRFFTNVSHELRTPLTLILGPMEELVTSAGQLAGLKDKVILMHTQTRKLLDLVNQLLDFRKVESGHVSLRVSQQDIVAFLTEIFLIFKLKAEELTLDYELEAPSQPVPLYFDRGKLEIILTNLLSNAVKYTPTGGKIRIATTISGNPAEDAVFMQGRLQANYVQISVRDWGVGMQPHELDKIFDPYYQASHTDTLRVMGTGIGLSLVKQLVERHSGEISVQSEPGLGTTFIVRLPFGKVHLSPVDIREDEAGQEESSYSLAEPGEPVVPDTPTLPPALPGSMRILVVEDNDDVRQYLKHQFETDYEVHLAADGLEGWEKALGLGPDLVISDIMMPRSDGLELCRKLKQHPKTLHIPVVLLTARASAIHELEGLETGADDYVTKPFNPKILFAKVSAILQNRFKLRTYYERQILLKPTEVVIPDEDKQFLEKAMKIVEARLTDPEFSVQVLVQEMGMSQSVFYRRIKSITGQTVVEFIRDVRMKRAAQLLADTSLRVSEIAFQVGIEDSKYFRQSFQKIYNVSPSEYARQHRKAEKEGSLEYESGV